jgi:hypothetical protein
LLSSLGLTKSGLRSVYRHGAVQSHYSFLFKTIIYIVSIPAVGCLFVNSMAHKADYEAMKLLELLRAETFNVCEHLAIKLAIQ